jgi:hypothetical protein
MRMMIRSPFFDVSCAQHQASKICVLVSLVFASPACSWARQSVGVGATATTGDVLALDASVTVATSPLPATTALPDKPPFTAARDIYWSPDGTVVIARESDGERHHLHWRSVAKARELFLHEDIAELVGFDGDANHIVFRRSDGHFYEWEPAKSLVHRARIEDSLDSLDIAVGAEQVRTACLSTDGTQAAVVGGQRSWHSSWQRSPSIPHGKMVSTTPRTQELTGSEGMVDCAFAPDGRHFALLGAGHARVFESIRASEHTTTVALIGHTTVSVTSTHLRWANASILQFEGVIWPTAGERSEPRPTSTWDIAADERHKRLVAHVTPGPEWHATTNAKGQTAPCVWEQGHLLCLNHCDQWFRITLEGTPLPPAPAATCPSQGSHVYELALSPSGRHVTALVGNLGVRAIEVRPVP